MSAALLLERPSSEPIAPQTNRKFEIGQKVYTSWIDEDEGCMEIREYCVVTGWIWVEASSNEIPSCYSNLSKGIHYVCKGIELGASWRDIFHESDLNCD